MRVGKRMVGLVAAVGMLVCGGGAAADGGPWQNDAEEAIKCLLDAGADPMHKPYGEETVIEYAERHYEKLVPLLKNHKPTAPKKR